MENLNQKPERTPAQQEASRRNGALSRGPVTPEGKAAVRFNALKHGASANSLILPGESDADFQALLADLIATLAPANPFQHRCVQRIAIAEWRYARSLAQEAASLELAMLDVQRTAAAKFGEENASNALLLASVAESNLLSANSTLESIRRQQARLRREIEAQYRLLTRLQSAPAIKK
jgi:hypothetical protein